MSTNTPAPTEDGGESNRPSRAWSAEDKRNLTISFVGGIAANIGVVLIIGAALAIDRLINHYPSHTRNIIYGYFAGLGIGVSIVFFGWLGIRRGTRNTEPLQEPFDIIVWVYLVLIGASLLVFLGIAAGLGK